MINQGNLIYLGPHFPTFLREISATSPDEIFTTYSHLNTIITPGNIQTSDHIPIILKIYTQPFHIKHREAFQLKKQTNWEHFQEYLNSKNTIKQLNNCTPQLERETFKWMNIVTDAVEISIPKTTHKPLYQIIKHST